MSRSYQKNINPGDIIQRGRGFYLAVEAKQIEQCVRCELRSDGETCENIPCSAGLRIDGKNLIFKRCGKGLKP